MWSIVENVVFFLEKKKTQRSSEGAEAKQKLKISNLPLLRLPFAISLFLCL